MKEKEVKEVYKILANYKNKLQLTQDLIQDIVMKVVKNYDEGKYNADKSTFTTWVYSIAKNHKITQDRKENGSSFEKEKQRSFLRIDVDIFESSLADENNDDKEIQLEKETLIKKAIEQLSEKEKDVIIKFYYEDYSVQQIAAEIEETESNIKTILFRTRNKIKVFLQKD
jgi:RNA polymerase sigma-70 factor (ECF subfamily)